MFRCFRCVLGVAILALSSLLLHAEGTKQVLPYATGKGKLCINKFRNDFAFYNGAEAFRLNIHVADVSESIRLGLGKVQYYTNSAIVHDLEFRISDPLGNIAYGPFPVPESGAGFIDSYSKAVAGPFPLAGGYNYLQMQPLVTGDYYLEFFYPAPYRDNTEHVIEFFDITVVNADGDAVDGRVWSKAWQFWAENPDAPPSDNRFWGKLMILSDDSIVTQVDCNGFIGGTFSFSSNATGCDNTGNIANDRASRAGFYTYPQYKVFLNDPDNGSYPTAKLRAGITDVQVDTNCRTGGFDIRIKAIKDGIVEILIDINPNPGADPQDVKLIASVLANPGRDGYNLVQWNGTDNLLNPVPNGTQVKISASYLSGMTHLPIYDIEYNDRGYIVSQVRPPGGQLTIYYDDSRIAGSMNVVTGCSDPAGCHKWTNYAGNERTINSWWYVTNQSIAANPVQSTRIPATPAVISGNAIYCAGSPPQEYSVPSDPNSESYTWEYTGTGVNLQSTGNKAVLAFAANASAGVLSVYGHNKECRNGKPVSLPVSVEKPPAVSISTIDSVCYTAGAITLTGGDPAGGIYKVDGVVADEFLAYKEDLGPHAITYTYAVPSTGCSDSAFASLYVRKGDDCEFHLIFPNAFTPNNDGLNDVFRPFGATIYEYDMQVFNSYGQLIFSTGNGLAGWDGTSNGNPCPTGVYIFIASYNLSLREGLTGSSRGKVTLLR